MMDDGLSMWHLNGPIFCANGNDRGSGITLGLRQNVGTENQPDAQQK